MRAQATGRLVALHVQLGDCVAPGDVIGQISQEDLKDTIDEEKSKLEDFRREDREFTRRLSAAAESVGLRLLDHVVVGREGCVSFREAGLM